MPRLSRVRSRITLPRILSSTTCRASSKSRPPAVPPGARIRRLTTSVSLRQCVAARSATRCAWAAACRTNRILPFASMLSFAPTRPCAWRKVSPRFFRDQQVLRESRDRARLKYLFMREGWTAESFLDELNRRIGFKLDPAVPEEIPDESLRDHVGIHPQRQPGLAYVGASVLRGRLTGEQLEAVADLAERFGSGLAARHRLAESRHRRRALRQDRRVGA